MKCAIVTADDFGRSPEVNQGIIQAHRLGVLTCASLMIAGPSAKEAVALAKRYPRLRVGLHLVLVDGFSVLTRNEIPRLVDPGGRFLKRPASAGLTYFLYADAKHQLAAECEAQMRAFLETGLALDHLNSHHHLHIHPTIAGMVVALARKYRIPAVRLPFQELGMLKRQSVPMAATMLPWTLLLRKRLRRYGIAHNHAIFGLYETGRMDEQNWLRLIPQVKPGITEIFCHPAKPSGAADASCAPHYAEYFALISEKVNEKLHHENIVLTTFSEIQTSR